MDVAYLEVVAKRLVSGAIMPLSLTLEGLFFSMVLLWLPRRHRAGRRILTVTVVFFFAVTNKWLSKRLIGPFETAYAAVPDYAQAQDLPANLRACKFIVVLGSGNGAALGRSSLDELSSNGLARLAEAVRMARLLPDAKIIFSGTTPEDRMPHARVMRAAAISLGLDPQRISLIEGVRDTSDEAEQLGRRLFGQSFILITSAWHLPRAVSLCRQRGLNPIAVPTDFLATPGNSGGSPDWGWDYDSLERSTWAFHEALGLIWTRR